MIQNKIFSMSNNTFITPTINKSNLKNIVQELPQYDLFNILNCQRIKHTNSIIVLTDDEFVKIKNVLPVNQHILIASIAPSQRINLVKNLCNARINNQNVLTSDPVVQLSSKISRCMILFLQKHGHPIYCLEKDEFDDLTLLNCYNNVTVNVQYMIKNNNQFTNKKNWSGSIFPNSNPDIEGMELNY
jgi:hypothetical protein